MRLKKSSIPKILLCIALLLCTVSVLTACEARTEGGITYTPSYSSETITPAKDLAEHAVIETDATALSIKDFTGKSSLLSVTINAPNAKSISIEAKAFQNCKGLASFTLNTSSKCTTTIRSKAFAGCGALRTLTMTDGKVKFNTTDCFPCSALSAVHVGSTVVEKAQNLFRYAREIETLTIDGGSVKFDGSTALNKLKINSMTVGNRSSWSVSSASDDLTVEHLYFRDDFTFDDTLLVFKKQDATWGAWNSWYAPIAQTIHLPHDCGPIPSRFFGDRGQATVRFDGTRQEWEALSVTRENNDNYYNGNLTVLDHSDTYCSVVFDTRGGKDIPDTVVPYGTVITQKPSYGASMFLGWFLDEGFTVPYNGEPVRSNLTLYAKWDHVNGRGAELVRAEGFDLRDDIYHGISGKSYWMTVGNATATFDFDADLIEATPYATIACDELGTTVELEAGRNDYTVTITSGNGLLTRSYRLVIYRKHLYTVDFFNGSSLIESQTVEEGERVTEPPAMSKVGYASYQWTCKGTAWDFDTAVTDSHRIYATWTPETYTVTLDSGSGLPSTATVSYETDFTLSPPDTSPAHYDFAGWQTRNGTLLTDADGNSLAPWSVTQGATLTAVWTPSDYVITYADVADGSHQNPATYTVEDAFVLQDATREGYDFVGWCNEDGDPVTQIAVGSHGALTLHAKWQIKRFTVTFTGHDGTVLDTQTVEYGSSASAPTPPDVDQKIFVSWDKEYGHVSSNLTVNAVYVDHVYTVTFDSNGGTSVDSQEVFYGTAPTAPTSPTHAEYPFDCWKLPDGSVYDFTTPLDGDVTLTAVWRDFTWISTVGDLALLNGSNKKFKLANDINLYNEVFPYIGSFSGDLDGNGHTIRAFTIDSTINAMLGTNSGTIHDLRITNVTVTHTPNGHNQSRAVLVIHNNGMVDGVHLDGVTFTLTTPHTVNGYTAGILSCNNNGTIRNCTITNATASLTYLPYCSDTTVTSKRYFGGFAQSSSGTIEQCYAKIDFSIRTNNAGQPEYFQAPNDHYYYFGGITAYAQGAVTGCYADVTADLTINGSKSHYDYEDVPFVRFGGIAAVATGAATVRESYAQASIRLLNANKLTANVTAGGLIGIAETGAQIKNCYSVSTICENANAVTYSELGCLIGQNRGNVRNSFAVGTLDTKRNNKDVGLLCGINTSTGIVSSCYARGCIITDRASCSSLIVGNNSGSVNSCYLDDQSKRINSRASLYALSDTLASITPFDGVWNEEFVSNTLFWDPSVWTLTDGVLPYLAALDRKTVSVYSSCATFGSVTAEGEVFSDSGSYVLTASPAGGYEFVGWYVGNTLVSSSLRYELTATQNAVYEGRFQPKTFVLLSVNDFESLTHYGALDGFSFELGANIDCAGQPLVMIDTLYGTLDGKGYTIYNFANTISSEFALIRNNRGTIRNLSLEGSISSTAEKGTVKMAFFAVNNYGTIENCSVTGEIKLSSYVKGVNSTVSATYYYGGIVAHNMGAIKDCVTDRQTALLYDTFTSIIELEAIQSNNDDDNTTTVHFYGGLIVGYNEGTVSRCSTGEALMGTVDNPVTFKSNVVSYRGSGMLDGNPDRKSTTVMNYYVGGIAGYNGSQAVLEQCIMTSGIVVLDACGTDLRGTAEVQVNVSEARLYVDGHVGGIVGHNGGSVREAYSDAFLSFTADNVLNLKNKNDDILSNVYARIGGIAGENSGTVADAEFHGLAAVSSASQTYVGSIVGANTREIVRCYGNGVILAEALNDGNRYFINVKFWEGFISKGRAGKVYVGGIAGINEGASISNCLSDYESIVLKTTDLRNALTNAFEPYVINSVRISARVLRQFTTVIKDTYEADINVNFDFIVGYGTENQRGTVQNCYYIRRDDTAHANGSELSATSTDANGNTNVTANDLGTLTWTDVWTIINNKPTLVFVQ